jgi:isomaltose glucohydrolase
MTAAERAPAPAGLATLAGRSIEIILAGQDAGGAYVASPSLPQYRYSWLRDGAFVADSLSRAGEQASAEAFFRWCAQVLEARAERIDDLVARRGDGVGPGEHVHARYTVTGRESDEPWATFQLDGYGAWVWALGAHLERHDADPEPFLDGAVLSLRYAAAFWEEPCYDWWEERLGLHTVTIAAIRAGLVAGAEHGLGPADEWAACAEAIRRRALGEGVHEGRLAAELGGRRLDASLVACGVPLGLLEADDPRMEATVAAIEERLVHGGGVHRHAEDTYYGGGLWLLLAGLLGLHYAEARREKDAWANLEWIAARAGHAGALPEQTDEHLLAPEARQFWLRRWGPPADPLLWSHAQFLTLANRLGVEPAGASGGVT